MTVVRRAEREIVALIFGAFDAEETDGLCSSVFRHLLQELPQVGLLAQGWPITKHRQWHRTNFLRAFGTIDDLNVKNNSSVFHRAVHAQILHQCCDIEALVAHQVGTIRYRRRWFGWACIRLVVRTGLMAVSAKFTIV